VNSWSLILQTLKGVSKATPASCPAQLARGTDARRVAPELRGQIQWPLQSLGSFLLTSQIVDYALNICRIGLKTTPQSCLECGSAKSSPALPAPPPGGVRDAGCGMRMCSTLGPLGVVLPPSASKVFAAAGQRAPDGVGPAG